MSGSSFSSYVCIMNLLGIVNQADKIEAALSPFFLVSSTLCLKQVLSACCLHGNVKLYQLSKSWRVSICNNPLLIMWHFAHTISSSTLTWCVYWRSEFWPCIFTGTGNPKVLIPMNNSCKVELQLSAWLHYLVNMGICTPNAVKVQLTSHLKTDHRYWNAPGSCILALSI